jgi:hypothetical protein
MSQIERNLKTPPPFLSRLRLEFNPGTVLVRFLDWFVRPTTPAVFGMLAVVLSFFVFAFAISDAALYGLVSVRALSEEQALGNPYLFRRMQRFFLDHDRYREVNVAIIGGSTSRESIWSEAALAADIKRFGGGKVQVLDLTSNGQRLFESWALAELAVCNGADVVMLGVNVNRFLDKGGIDRRDPFFLVGSLGSELESFVRSGSINPQYARLTHRIFDRPAFVVQTMTPLLEVLLGAPSGFNVRDINPEGLRHGFLRSSDVSQKAEKIARVEREFVKKGGRQFKIPVLERIQKTVERCGGRLIPFVPPVNPDMIDPLQNPTFSAAYAAHNDYLRATFGNLLVLNEHIPYRRDVFFDWGHLATEESIRATTETIAREIAPQLKESDP